jgi:hypothetical protein
MMRHLAADILQRGLTPRQFARLYAISRNRVIAMLKRGELGGVKLNGRGGRVSYRIMPHHIATWEQRYSAAETPAPRRRRKRTGIIDFYPADGAIDSLESRSPPTNEPRPVVGPANGGRPGRRP